MKDARKASICTFFFWLFKATPAAYGGSQVKGLQPTAQPQQRQIQAAFATYTTAQNNAGSLTHWARAGIKPSSSWMLGSLTTEPWRELPYLLTLKKKKSSDFLNFIELSATSQKAPAKRQLIQHLAALTGPLPILGLKTGEEMALEGLGCWSIATYSLKEKPN